MVLTASDAAIKRLVGAARLRRGVALLLQEEVTALVVDGQRLQATVGRLNRARVQVWFDEPDQPVSASCSLCDGLAGCEHVAAALLGLRNLDQKAPAPSASASSAPAPPPEDPDQPPRAAGMEALLAWAQPRGLAPALASRAADLPGVDRRSSNWFWYAPYGTTIAELLIGLPRGPRPISPPPDELINRALAWLKEEEAAVLQARAAEAEAEVQRKFAPADPVLAALWTQLREARPALRKEAEPARPQPRPTQRILINEDPPQVFVLDPRRPACGSGQPASVTLNLRPGPGQPLLRCDCPGPRKAGCSMVLGACDAVLDALCATPAPPVVQEIRRTLSANPWERALGHFDRVLQQVGALPAPQAAPDPDRITGWQLRVPRSNGIELLPISMVPFKTKAGWRTRLESRSAWSARPHALALDADREVLRHLDAPEDDRDAPFQAALALEGHPRVLDSEGAPVAVRRVQAGLDWTADSVGGLTMYLRLGPQRLSENEAQDLLKRAPTSNYLAHFEPGRLLVAEMPAGAMELLFALSQRGWSYPPEAVGPLLERVQDISRLLPIHLDAGLRGEPVPRDPRPLLRLDAMGNGTLAIDLRVRPLPDGPAFPPGEGPEELSVVRLDGRVYVRRPLDVETADLADVLGELPGLAPPYLSWRRYIDDPEEALDLVQCLQERPDAVQVEWAGERRRVSRPAEASDLNLGMGPGRDWLQLTGFADVDGLVVDLAVLLAAIREGRRFVRVDDAAWMRISDRLRDQLQDLAAATWTGRKGLELSPLAGGLLEGLAAEGAEVDPPPDWILDREKVRQAQSLTLSPPPGLRADLRPYQQVGAEWMARLAHWAPGACLADDMGLGKTLQAITLLLRRAPEGPALVVAPTSVGFNWKAEIARFAPSLQVLAYRDAGREKLLQEAGPHRVFITSYDLVHRDVEALSAHRWRTLVLDEAQAIKNPDTRRAKAIFQLPADFVLALTGTPVENRTGELWSLMRAVAPGLLGSAGAFRERFAIPIERLQDTRRQAALSNLLRPFLLRRLKRDVAPELPPRQEQVVGVELSLAERALYNRARLEAIAELSGPDAGDPEVRRFRVLAALTRLRQLACHPKLAEPDSPVPSSKLEALLELLDEAHEGGHKALVFSQFTKHLDLVQAALTAQGRTILRLDGSTPASERQARVQAFQRGNTDVFLLSLKAGGTGLNLTAATVVLHLDPWWNPAVEDQATDRAHRIGQSEPVTVYRLVSQATVEEAILDLHAEKRALVASLLEGTGSPARFGTEELMRLLG